MVQATQKGGCRAEVQFNGANHVYDHGEIRISVREQTASGTGPLYAGCEVSTRTRSP